MTPGEESAETLTKKWQPTPLMFYGAVGAATVLLVWAIAASVSGTSARTENAQLKESSAKTLASTKADYEGRLAESKKAALTMTTQAVAATLQPLVANQGLAAAGADRSLQGVVRSLVKNRALRFVAIADPSGNVLASSDLTLVGRPINPPSGMSATTAPIGEPSLGTVALGVE